MEQHYKDEPDPFAHLRPKSILKKYDGMELTQSQLQSVMSEICYNGIDYVPVECITELIQRGLKVTWYIYPRLVYGFGSPQFIYKLDAIGPAGLKVLLENGLTFDCPAVHTHTEWCFLPTRIFEHCIWDARELIQVLFDFYPDRINSTDINGRTALHLACKREKMKTVNYLLNAGANVQVLDCWYHTPRDALSRRARIVFDRIMEEIGLR